MLYAYYVELTEESQGQATTALDVVAPLAQQQANELRVMYAPDVGIMTTDAGKVRQILINLLANAAKFTDQGVITLHAWRDNRTPHVAASAGASIDNLPVPAVIFEVSDTGIGIAPDHLVRLFQPFSQVDASVTRRYEGTGLGLALRRQLCLALGGTISVVSAPDCGTTFMVCLPVEAPTRQASARTPILGVEAHLRLNPKEDAYL